MRLPLRRVRRSSSETVSVVISLKGNAEIFSPVCDSKIRAIEDVGIDAIEVHLVKLLLFL